MTDELLINGTYLLQKFPGKGGWTYAALPGLVQEKTNPFGWVKVRGFVDDYELKQYKLMPMGQGRLFLPVKAAVRKAIQKESGDYVKVILFKDTSALLVPQEIEDCFDLENAELRMFFMKLSEGERKRYLDWIYSAKTEETKAQRIVKMMESLSKELRFQEMPKTIKR